MLRFIIIFIFTINVFGNDNFDTKYKKCGDESLKKELGNVEICLIAISTLEKKLFISKKDNKLSSLYNYTAYIYEAKKDYSNAAKMFQKSIECNTSYSDLAKINLGTLYYYGNGVTKNYTKTYKLWKQVVENGDWTGNATHNLDYLCNKHSWACK